MAGVNPYLKNAPPAGPTKGYTIEFLPEGRRVTVDPEQVPTSDTGIPGSILDIALASGIEIDHACGGVCACSTCHVIVEEGLEYCGESSEDEEDQLEEAPGLTTRSRLACQCVPNGKGDLVVQIPSWNRNL